MRGVAVGVDAGGTSTTASYSQDGVFREMRTGEGASATALGTEEAAKRIVAVIEGLIAQESPASIYVGAAGAGRDEIAQRLREAIAVRYAGALVHVSDDAHIALRATVPRGAGLVLIAGTGSIAYAENTSGDAFRAGGYGYLLGDDGSGFSIGMAALKWLAKLYDGRGVTDDLCEELQNRLGIADRSGLFDLLYGPAQPPVALVASLAPVVVSMASNGVRSAHKIVQAAAMELSDLIKTVAKKSALSGEVCPLVLGGGLLRENSVLSFLLETRLQADLPSAEILKRAAEPHRGALAAAEAMIAAQ
jgi:N-acetylglucosamine kinase-like BadF-type ATPase